MHYIKNTNSIVILKEVLSMFKSKKAQGMTLNIVVVAVIVLLVMLILILVFTGRIGIFTTETDKCENKGGFCQDKCDRASLEAEINAKCVDKVTGKEFDPKKLCCVKAVPTA